MNEQLKTFRFEFTGEEKFRIKTLYAINIHQAYRLANEYLMRNNVYDDWKYLPAIIT